MKAVFDCKNEGEIFRREDVLNSTTFNQTSASVVEAYFKKRGGNVGNSRMLLMQLELIYNNKIGYVVRQAAPFWLGHLDPLYAFVERFLGDEVEDELRRLELLNLVKDIRDKCRENLDSING